MAKLMLYRGQLVPRDESEFCIWLCCHGETKGGAWIVSLNPDAPERALPEQGGVFFLPKAMAERSLPHGVFERMSMRTCQRQTITVHEFSMPKFIAIEKRLVA